MSDKFCKDCRYSKIIKFDLTTKYECFHEKVSTEFDLITGRRILEECHEARYGYLSGQKGPCGKKANYFEPRES